jgi:hypothetical protein
VIHYNGRVHPLERTISSVSSDESSSVRKKIKCRVDLLGRKRPLRSRALNHSPSSNSNCFDEGFSALFFSSASLESPLNQGLETIRDDAQLALTN